MRIKFAEVLNISIPFKKSFEHSLAVHNQVNSVILIVETERGVIGYGECIPRKYVTGETTGSVMKQLNEIILPQLLGKEFLSMGQLKDWLLEFNQHFGLGERDLCVQCVVDLALVDAFCKETGKNVADYLGPLQKRLIYYSAVVSAGNTQKVFKTLLKYKAMMINQVKLKVGTDHGQDLFNLMMVRKILGVNAEIRVDADAMWDLNETLIKLKDFARYGVISIEQPMPVQLKDQYPILVEQLRKGACLCG